MAQFDYHAAPHGAGFWLDCQTDLMSAFNTRFIAPLLPKDDAPLPVRGLNPVFEIEGQDYLMATQLAGAVHASRLGKAEGSLSGQRDEILNALDFLISGV